jgi:hypothetical protein
MRGGPHGFETREDALLTTRVGLRAAGEDLVLRSGRQAASRRMGHDKSADEHLLGRDANAPGLLREPPSRTRGRRECRVCAAAVHATAPGTSQTLGKRVVAHAFHH